jgi:hypothetical protein
MTRSLTANASAQTTAAVLRPHLFFEGEFSGSTLRMWTGFGPITWNGQTWEGVGNLVGVTAIEESNEVRARGVRVALAGVPSSMVSLALGNVRQNMPGRIWLGFLDSAGAVVADPFLAFEGRCDVAAVEDGPETATVTVSYEDELIDLERSRERRFTHEDQQIDYAGDLGFAFVTAIQDAEIVWGRS